MYQPMLPGMGGDEPLPVLDRDSDGFHLECMTPSQVMTLRDVIADVIQESRDSGWEEEELEVLFDAIDEGIQRNT